MDWELKRLDVNIRAVCLAGKGHQRLLTIPHVPTCTCMLVQGIELKKLVEAGSFISNSLNRRPASKVAQATSSNM